MGYKVLGRTEELLKGYTARKGLEGPFLFGRNNLVLYYDPREGKYWNPITDFYIEQAEMDFINASMIAMLKT